MKRLLILGSVALFSLTSPDLYAQNRAVKIFSAGEFLSGHVTGFLDSGEIIHVPSEKTEAVERLKRSLYLGESFTFEADATADQAPVVEVLAPAQDFAPSEDKEMYDPARWRSIQWNSYDPMEKSNITAVASYEAAQSVMDGMNGETSDDSQCYNRAHMWTYEALVNQRVNLGKTWIFFTKKYIREFRYKWWFHVSPHTVVGAERFHYMLDRGFTMIPYTLENWKNIFMQNQANCPVVTDYRQYEDRQEAAYCYLIHSSQYYWQPWQLKKLSVEGEHYYGYKNSELKIAYPNALKSWSGSIPVLRNPLPNPDIDGQNPRPNPNPNPNPQPNPNPNPRPNPEPNPRPNPDFSRRLGSGDTVLYQSALYRPARVLTVGINDTYEFQFLDGAREIWRNVSRQYLALTTGCNRDICVGDRVVNTALHDQIVYNRIIGITQDGLFAVQFEEGTSTNGRSWGWHESHFARTNGCNNAGWCVGDEAYSRMLGASVRVLGVGFEGLVLEITSGRQRSMRVKFYRDQLSRL
jgi:hypothetical protein